MIRTLCSTAATAALGATLLAGSTAHAAGTLVQGDGSFVGGITNEADIANVRAVLFQQGSEVTAIVQSATRADQSISSAWILPIGGTILKPPAAADPAIIAELLRTTDPIFEPTIGGVGCGAGCTALNDSGLDEYANLGVFDTSKAGATWTYFGPDAIEPGLESLEGSGYDISSDLASGLRDHAANGGSFVVAFFDEARADAASPAIVVRYESSEMMLPQALTALSAETIVQTSILTITEEGAVGPVGVPHATPTLGVPLYDSLRTPEFYQARALLALEAAGDGAWLLEYSNLLGTLDERSEKIVDPSIFWDGPELPWGGLRALVDRDLLGSFQADKVWITRWRTIQEPTFLADQVFAPDASVPAYEVYVEASQYSAAASWVWPMPLLLGAWAFRRRRRHD